MKAFGVGQWWLVAEVELELVVGMFGVAVAGVVELVLLLPHWVEVSLMCVPPVLRELERFLYIQRSF